METVVNQTLGNVFTSYTGVLGDSSDVDNALVGNQAVLTGVEKWEGMT